MRPHVPSPAVLRLAVLTLAGAAAASAAGAQQRVTFPPLPLPVTAEAPTLSFTVSQSLEADSNFDLVNDPGGTTYLGETRVAADYLRAFETRRFGLGIDTGLRGLQRPDEDFEWVTASPSTGYANYQAEGVDSLFDLELTARSREVDSISTLDFDPSLPGPDIPDDLNQFRQDTREFRYDANVGFALGTTSPSTYGLRVLASSIDYSEEGDNLTPRTTVNPQANWTLQLTPVLSGALFGGYYYYDADNQEQTQIRVGEADAGVIYEPSERLRVGFGLGYADRRETNEVQRQGITETETERETGPVVRGDVYYALPDFSLYGNARWTTAAPDDNRFSGFVSATYTLPRGRVTGRVFQRATGDTSGEVVRVTGAAIGLQREINSVSRVGLDLGWASQVSLDDNADPDITRTDLTASYEYDITAVVTAEVGYTYQTREEDPVDTDGHRVYLLLGRTFETGL